MKKIFGAILCVMLGFCGLAFSACTPNYDNITMSLSTNKIEMAVGETQTFNLQFENAPKSFNTDVHLGNVNSLFSVVSSEKEDNKVFFEIKATKSGKTTVQVLSYEGNKTASFDVEVFTRATSFEAKSNLYIVAEDGNRVTLANQSYFNFLPANCKVPQMQFSYNEHEVASLVVEADQSGKNFVKMQTATGENLTDANGGEVKFAQGEIILTATPLDYITGTPMTSISAQEVRIQIVPQIETGDLRLLRKGGILATATKYYDDASKVVVDKNDVITIIKNKITDSYLVFEVECDTPDVQMSISSTICECTEIASNNISELEGYASTHSNSKFFSVQATTVGTDKITIILSYTSNTTFGQTTYEKEISFDVVAITSPYQINANNIAHWQDPVAIYDNAQSPYAIYVNVLDKLSSFESVKVSLATKNLAGDLIESNEYFEYLNITYKNQQKVAAFEIPFEEFSNNTSILPINVLAQSVFAQPIFIVLTVQPLQIEGASPIAIDVQTVVPLQIKEGIKSFTLAPEYTIQQDGLILPRTLYLDVDAGAKVFDGFEIINLASIELDEFKIEYRTGDESILGITQIVENGQRTKKLELTPHKTGFVQVRVTAQDGFFADLEFQVVKSLSGATLSVNPSDDITQTTADANGNIAELQVAYTGENSVQFAITKNESDASLFTVQANVDKPQIADVAKVQNDIVIVRIFDMTMGDEFATLSITLAMKEVSETFEVVDAQTQENNITFTVNIFVYCPIESLQFVQVQQDDAGKPVQTEISGFSINRLGDVGYKYDTMAKAQCDFHITLTNGDVIEDVFDEYYGAINIMTSYGALISRGENFFINQFGDFAIMDNTLFFNCNYEAALTGTFVFTITLVDHNVTHSAALSINVKTFTPLEYVGITNYQETLYLSGTNDNFTFFTYMDPLADIQKFDVVFVPSAPQYSNLLNISVNGDCSQVYVEHNSMVTNGSGTLYFVPRTMFAEGDVFPTNRVQKVNVVYSDGTDEAFPELISTAEEFMAAVTQAHTAAKHYLIISSIDLDGYTFENVKPLAGSISGGNANAKLVNVHLNITDKNATNAVNNFGLFPKILQGAKLNDLVIEGSVNVAIENLGQNKTYNIGLVAGENLGTLTNISVRLQNSNAVLEDNSTSNKIFIGGFVGTNSGTIQNGQNPATPNTFMFNFENAYRNQTAITAMGAFEAIYTGKSAENAFGGLVGKNLGNIVRPENQIAIYNNSNYTEIINISTVGFAQTGGVAGQNGAPDNDSAKVQNQAITGTISAIANNGSGGENVGGVVGTNFACIADSTMRAQISAKDYVGGIVGLDNVPQKTLNNKVQAAKSFNIKPLLTALSSSGNIGAFCGNLNVENIYKTNGNIAQCFFEINLAQRYAPIFYHFLNGDYQMVTQGAFVESTDAIAIIGINESASAQKFGQVHGIEVNHIANMFIWLAENSQQQSLVNYLNTNREIPFVFAQSDSIIISSLNPEILTIDAFGKITLYQTGVATLQIQSVLDASITSKVYINVSNAFDTMKIQSLSGDELASGAFINVFNHSPASIKFSFSAKSVYVAGDMGQIVEVQFEQALAPTVKIQYEHADYIYTTAQKYGNLIIFTSTNQTLGSNQMNTVTFIPTFEISFTADSTNISASLTNFDTISSDFAEVQIDVVAKLGTQSITTNFADASVEPVDNLNLEITQITDFKDDTIDFAAVKITDNVGGPQDYFKIKTQIKNQTFDSQTNTYHNVYALTLAFDYEKYPNNYEDIYYLSFTANNGKNLTLITQLATQNIESVSLKNYYDIQNTYSVGGTESNQVSSGDYNLLEINLYPYFADYDYILIKNHEENYTKNNLLLMQVMTVDAQNNFVVLPGVEYLPEGVVVSKEIMTTQKLLDTDVARLFIRYTTISKATVDTQAKIVVETFKLTNQTPITQNILSLNVVVKDTVFFTLDAREQANEYYLARGLSYDLSLNIYGFTEDQVKVEITHEGFATNAVRIQKIDGQYQLSVSKNITYSSTFQNQQGYEVEITTYAENVIDGIRYQSGKSTLKIIIVDFVILQQNLGAYSALQTPENFNKSTLIAGAEGAMIGLAVGNPYTLENAFVFGQTVEYDETNDEIFKNVQRFEDSLTQNGDWTITAVNIEEEVLGKFVQSLPITNQSNLTSDYLKIVGRTITPLRINDHESTKYYFSYQGAYYYQFGQAVFGQNAKGFDVSTDFVFDVYPNSNFDNAIPINNVQEFLEMNDNAHYILLHDITLPQTFVPLDVQVASFDGNGHTITMPSNLLFQEGDRFGLFATLAQGAVLKNIKLAVPTVTTITIINNESTIAFGALVGENNGIITNCKLVGSAFAQLVVSLPNQTQNIIENYVAGLVGINNGFITNSYVSVDMSAAANVSGFVGVNNGKVSSSFVRESMIVNKSSNSEHKTAGFVIKNGSSANSTAAINGCYVAGATSTTSIYSQNPAKAISSMPKVSGFVYSNFNSIQDCYSDILINTSSICAGFAMENSGHIARTYTTSTFSNPGQEAYIFVQSDRIDGAMKGSCEDCFFLVGSVNAEANMQFGGLTALSDADFANASIFENFAISSNINKTEGVWFWPAKGMESAFKNENTNLSFTFGRPELVAANLLANTQKVLDAENTTTNPQTGETIYVYTETKSALGSKFNPIVIHNAETFERYLNNNQVNNTISSNFRLISDINFRDTVNISNTHSLIINSTIEGNNMEISGFSIDTREKAYAKGLFSQIASSGVVKNLKLSPYYLNTPNAKAAGTLAGALVGGKVFNIVCDGFNAQNDGIKVVGQNAVGGVIGIASGNFKLQNIASSISTNASYNSALSSKQFCIFQTASNLDNVSVAGGIVGIAHSGGQIINAKFESKGFTTAEVCGLLFGVIGKNVETKNINQVITPNHSIKPLVYGGVIAGIIYGMLENVDITGEASADFIKKADTAETSAIGVGGICGLLAGGTIQNADVSVNLVWNVIAPQNIGGIVGDMIGGNISAVEFNGDITACASNNAYNITSISVGGIVGRLAGTTAIQTSKSLTPTDSNIAFAVTNGKIELKLVNVLTVYVGGAIGHSIMVYSEANNKLDDTDKKYKTLPRIQRLSGVQNNMDIVITNTIYGGVLTTFVAGLVGATFADNSKFYPGEIVIYDKAKENILLGNYQSVANGKIAVTVIDNKSSAQLNTWYGGILGYGKAVNTHTVLVGLYDYKNNPWGLLLETSQIPNNQTSPEYSGKWKDEECTIREEFLKTNFITLIPQSDNIQTNYTENALN